MELVAHSKLPVRSISWTPVAVVHLGLAINCIGATTITEQDNITDEYNKAVLEFKTGLAVSCNCK